MKPFQAVFTSLWRVKADIKLVITHLIPFQTPKNRMRKKSANSNKCPCYRALTFNSQVARQCLEP